MKKIKVFEAFTGYGGASFGLKKAKIPYEVIGYSEVDKFASELFNGNFPDIKNFGDITKINPNEIPDFDLFTGGFPCQPFSQVGLGKGERDTRGTLFHNILKICEVKKPKHILLENVKGLITKKHEKTLETIVKSLEKLDYHVTYKLLNSKEVSSCILLRIKRPFSLDESITLNLLKSSILEFTLPFIVMPISFL